MVILEGMASGLPLIATAVGDVPKVVRNGETGILLPAGDPEALASAIVRSAPRSRQMSSLRFCRPAIDGNGIFRGTDGA